ncbi:hypothetical protein [Pseudoxanthomonas kalamensis]|uniref:hypothetical protein n=1 Tax=Pseudoxanthomonas kalamensis TaxID=289483 RepID=UPI00139133B6|nr:hypothetical protein [Pseudoxanthomonas kalamensis]
MLALLAVSSPSSAQESAASASGQWQPDSKQNDKLFKEAEKAFKKAAKEMQPPEGRQGGPPPRGGPGGDRGGGGGPPPNGGGMGGAPGGGAGGPPGGGPPPGGGRRAKPSLSGLLPAELAFAAPSQDSLILQRMRQAMVFGRGESASVVIVPFEDQTALGNGVTVKMTETDGQPELQATTPNGLLVSYRYQIDTDGTLRVHINISGGPMPRGGFELERVYRRMQVDVSAPERAGG